MAIVAASIASGCGGRAARVDAPDWDPDALAQAALEQFDSSGNAQLDGDELAASPALASTARFIDANGDQTLTANELAARFEQYVQSRVGLKSQTLVISYNGRPVADAEVVLTPENFLADVVQPARGTTNAQGDVTPTADGQKLPAMQLGFYRVQVTSPRRPLPAKFNVETTIGVEVTPNPDDEAGLRPLEIRLKD
jgi:hypothetical protein